MYYSSSIHFSAATALWETSSDCKHFANSSIGLKNMYNALNSPRHCGVCSFILAVKFLNTGRISTELVNSVCSSPSPVDGSFIAGITVRVNEPLTFLPQKTYFETKYYHYDLWLSTDVSSFSFPSSDSPGKKKFIRKHVFQTQLQRHPTPAETHCCKKKK